MKITLVSLFFILSSLTTSGQPFFSTDLENNTFNWGELEIKRSHETEIWFTNTGDEPLVILRAYASDGGMVSSCTREPIPPGGSERILVRFSTMARSPGPFSKAISVLTNEPEGQNRHVLRLMGNYIEPFGK